MGYRTKYRQGRRFRRRGGAALSRRRAAGLILVGVLGCTGMAATAMTRLTTLDTVWQLAAQMSTPIAAWREAQVRLPGLGSERLVLRAGDLLLPYRSSLLPTPQRQDSPASYQVIRYPVHPPRRLRPQIAWFSPPEGESQPETGAWIGFPPTGPEPRVISLYPAAKAPVVNDLIPVQGESPLAPQSEWNLVRATVMAGTRAEPGILHPVAQGRIVATAGQTQLLRLTRVHAEVHPGDLLLPAVVAHSYDTTRPPKLRPALVPEVHLSGFGGSGMILDTGQSVLLQAGLNQAVTPGALYRIREPEFTRHDPLRAETVTYPSRHAGVLLTLRVYPDLTQAVMLRGEVHAAKTVTLEPYD